MNRLKIISIERTLEQSNFELPTAFYSSNGKCLDYRKYREFDGVSDVIEFSWIAYISEGFDKNMRLTYVTRKIGCPISPLTKFGNAKVERLLREVNDKLLISYQKALNLVFPPEKNQLLNLSTDSNLECFESLFMIKRFSQSVDFEVVKPELTYPELAAVNLEYYDNLFYCIESNQSKGLLRNWDYSYMIDSVTDRKMQRIISNEISIKSQLARENQALSTRKFIKVRSLVEAHALEIYSDETTSRMRTMQLAEGLSEKIIPVFCTDNNLKIPKVRTVNEWIKELVQGGVNKIGRPNK